MILGIGVDLVKIPRMESWLRNPGLMERFFHPSELKDVQSLSGPGQGARLATRFAAKEALAKALGTGLGPLVLKEIQVGAEPGGRPVLQLHGATRRLAEGRGVQRCHLSLSHEGDLAQAFVVLEGASPESHRQETDHE